MPSGYDYSDLPGYDDAAAESRNEREARRAARDPDNFGLIGHYVKPVPPQSSEVKHG